MPHKNMDSPPPTQIMEDLWAAWRAPTLVAAVELGLFRQFAEGRGACEQIAASLGVSEPALRRLLDALVGMGYLKKGAVEYELEPVAERYLVPGGEFYVEGIAQFARRMSDDWWRLGEVIKSGRSLIKVDDESRAREFFPTLVRHIFPWSFAAASAAVSTLPKAALRRIGRILDVAAGSAAWSIAFAKALPSARVTVLDFPEVIAIARSYAQRFGVADRFGYLEGNLRATEFPQTSYDLVILGHIIHSEGQQWGKQLIAKAFSALDERGVLLIADLIPTDNRTGPAMPLLFSLNMLLHTESGDVFTMAEYRHWLAEAGFKKVATLRAPAPSPLIFATK